MKWKKYKFTFLLNAVLLGSEFDCCKRVTNLAFGFNHDRNLVYVVFIQLARETSFLKLQEKHAKNLNIFFLLNSY